jgi:hypothetical protein
MRRRTPRQTWTDHTDLRVRVLLECEPESTPAIIASVIERHGYAVRSCEGPDAHGCDLLVNGVCALVDGADVVVNMLRTPVVGRNILNGVAAVRRPPAVVAEVRHSEGLAASGSVTDPPGVDLDRVTVMEAPVTGKALISAIERAVERRNRPVPIWGDGFC